MDCTWDIRGRGQGWLLGSWLAWLGRGMSLDLRRAGTVFYISVHGDSVSMAKEETSVSSQ